MNGAQALVMANKPKGRYAIIGEPTNLKPVNMHKGIMQERIFVQGRAGHASNPMLGNNAIEAMHQMTTELMTYRDELAARFQHKAFEVSHPTLNLGCIHGGDSPNRICGECELLIDIRTLPGMNHDDVRNNMRERLSTIAARLGVSVSVESLFPGLDPFATPEHSALIKAVEKLTAHEAISVGFGTEAPFLQALGFETVILGAGDIAQAHQPNEYVALDRLNPMITILKNLIHQFCYSAL
jgi:acetylornithine deacetylase